MKYRFNKVLCFLLTFFIIGVANVSAKTVEEFDNLTYIIGTHEFTSDMALTTDRIMFAARTIDGNNLEDMKIYFKDPYGVLINAITGKEIKTEDIPDNFNIEYINLNSVLEDAKEAALSALETAFSKYNSLDYSGENWAILEEHKTDGDSEINAATTIETVNAAKTNAINAMAGVLTLDQEATAEANTFKSEHNTVLLLTVETVAITDKPAVNTALTAYDSLSASSKGKVSTEKTLLDSLLTKIVELEAAKALSDEKTAALSALETAFSKYNSLDYSGENWAILEEHKTDGDSEINAATT
ncbi:MAG: hypothetical protein PHO63_05545, partial [Bacilli bacterium]|nr:hypothetical protein [Bacilli bacterium]